METDNLIKIIKLSSSETVVGKITSETDTTITVFQPLRTVIVPSKLNSGFNLAMMRWEMFFEFEHPVEFNKYAIIAIGKVNSDIKTAYIEAIKKYNEVSKHEEEDVDNPAEKDLEMILSALDIKGKVIH